MNKSISISSLKTYLKVIQLVPKNTKQIHCWYPKYNTVATFENMQLCINYFTKGPGKRLDEINNDKQYITAYKYFSAVGVAISSSNKFSLQRLIKQLKSYNRKHFIKDVIFLPQKDNTSLVLFGTEITPEVVAKLNDNTT